MAKKSQTAHSIIEITLTLAGELGWRRLTLADIARRAGMTVAELHHHFPDKAAILAGFSRWLDHQAMAAAPDDPQDVTSRDRLFDVMMRRFEAMAPYRPGLRAILTEGIADPMAVLCGARRLPRSMALMLETAGISASGLSGLLRIEGLAAIHLYVLRAFLDDESADLSQTMAALDKALRRAEAAAAMLWRRPGDAARRDPSQDEAPAAG